MIRFLKWFHGYLLVVIRGYSPERFINLCRNRNILIWDLRRTEEGDFFYISVKAFRKLAPVVRKTHTLPLIRKRYGFPFQLARFKKRKAFLFGLVLFSAILYTLSLFIWDISMEGQQTHTQESLLKFLKEIDVYPGRLKKDLNCQNIEEAIRNQYKDIGWVSAEIKGTRLRLKLVETNMPVPYEAADKPCHLVASHDGVVASIVTRKGTPMVKKGDQVKKGDVLISGVVDIIGDNDVLLKKEAVISDGDVIIQTKYPYEAAFPMQYEKRSYTGQTSTAYGITLFDKNFFFFNPLKKFKNFEKYDIILNKQSLKLNASFCLPVTLFKKVYRECEEEPAVYTKEEAQKKAEEALRLYMERLSEKDVRILENHVQLSITDGEASECKAFGWLLVEEKAEERKKVRKNEWRMKQTDESDGTNH